MNSWCMKETQEKKKSLQKTKLYFPVKMIIAMEVASLKNMIIKVFLVSTQFSKLNKLS